MKRLAALYIYLFLFYFTLHPSHSRGVGPVTVRLHPHIYTLSPLPPHHCPPSHSVLRNSPTFVHIQTSPPQYLPHSIHPPPPRPSPPPSSLTLGSHDSTHYPILIHSAHMSKPS